MTCYLDTFRATAYRMTSVFGDQVSRRTVQLLVTFYLDTFRATNYRMTSVTESHRMQRRQPQTRATSCRLGCVSGDRRATFTTAASNDLSTRLATSFSRSVVRSVDRSFARYFVRSMGSSLGRMICSFGRRSFVRSFVRLFVRSFVRSFVHSFVWWGAAKPKVLDKEQINDLPHQYQTASGALPVIYRDRPL